MLLVVVTIILWIILMTDGCQYYANFPLEYCQGHITYSNYFYCNDSNFLFKDQYANGECQGGPAYTLPLCDTADANCIASCDGDPCQYVLFKNYDDCNRSSDFTETPYFTDHCHSISGSGYSSVLWQCNGDEIEYNTYSDSNCNTLPISTTTAALETIETECSDIEFYVECEATTSSTETPTTTSLSTTSMTTTMDDNNGVDASCPFYGYSPLDVCTGHNADTVYSNYFYCDDSDYLYWKTYANNNCSGDAEYDMELCDTNDADCIASCDGKMCQYFIQRAYTNCDKSSNQWNEVAYPAGYCINLSTLSMMAECDGIDNVVYTQYTDTECQEVDLSVTVELDGYPTINENDCVDTYFYVECDESTTGSQAYKKNILFVLLIVTMSVFVCS